MMEYWETTTQKRKHKAVIPVKAGIQLLRWFPAFAGTTPGLPLEFIPMKIGAGATNRYTGFIR